LTREGRITLGVIVSLLGLGALLVLIFAFAVYVVPVFVGLTVGMWAFETGAGVIGAVLLGLVAGVVALLAAQALFASARSLPLRIAVAFVFAMPAAVTGYHAALGIAELLVPSATWRHVFAAIGGVTVGASALVQLTRFEGAPAAGRWHVAAGRSGEPPAPRAGPDQPRMPSRTVARLPAPSSGSRA
jgi:hypothetical protein